MAKVYLLPALIVYDLIVGLGAIEKELQLSMNQNRIAKMSQIFVWKTLCKEIILIVITMCYNCSIYWDYKVLHCRDNDNSRNNF